MLRKLKIIVSAFKPLELKLRLALACIRLFFFKTYMTYMLENNCFDF
jgi:hypothetical protein